MKIKLILGASILLLVSVQANASIIDNGDRTTDSVSGLDWLDVTFSMNRSYDEVSAQFGDGIKTHITFLNHDSHGYPVGSWLVRNSPISPIPVPAVIWLFGTALIGLVGFNRRRIVA